MASALSSEQRAWIAAELRRAVSQRANGDADVRGEPPVLHLFALLDSSRDPEIITATIEALASRYECLYRGQARIDYGEHAPWLIELARDEDVLDWIMDDHFGRAHASFFISAFELRDLATHFRRFVKVRGDRNDLVFYRFFDPFILNHHLPIFSIEQRRAFFAPIVVAYAELDATSLFSLRLTSVDDVEFESFSFDRVTMDSELKSESIYNEGASNSLPTYTPHVRRGRYPPPTMDMKGSAVRPFFAFSDDQHAAFRDAARLRSRFKVLSFLRDAEPRDVFDLPDEKLIELVKFSERTGRELGVRTELGHAHWAYLIGLTKGRAATMPEVKAVLLDGRDSPDANVERLLRLTAETVRRQGLRA